LGHDTPKPPKQYAVFAGYVRSKYDGQWHWISCDELIRLYRVPPAECVRINGHHGDERGRDFTALIELHPRRNGDYLEHLEYLLFKKKGTDQ
jgi:hypothetical protein